MSTHPSVSLVLGTSTGGVGAHVASLVRGLLADDWPVTVCGPDATDKLFGFSRAGAVFRPVQIAGAVGDLPAAITLRRACGGAALVHAHGLRAATVAVLAGTRPLVVTWHNAMLATGPRRALLTAGERLVARRATLTLAASGDLADRVRQLGGRDVRVAPVAIALAEPTRSPEQTRAELGIDTGRPLVLSIARLHPQKGLDVLVDAAARWTGLQAQVVIAGEGPLHAELAARVAASRAPVRLLGRRTDVADLLAAADLVVLPSRWEARSLAAQEALYAGRALVATAVGGLPELLGDGARLVRPDDVDALEVAVRELLADPDGRAALAARGRQQAARWPKETDTIAQVAAVYRELLGVAP